MALLALVTESAAGYLLASPEAGRLETTVVNAVQWLRLGVEAIGAAIIGLGVAVAAWQVAHALVRRQPARYNHIRLTLGRYLALGLEFQLGADILSSAVAPSWDQIGNLGAIAVIRTGLNFFLMREIREEDAARAEKPQGEPPG